METTFWTAAQLRNEDPERWQIYVEIVAANAFKNWNEFVNRATCWPEFYPLTFKFFDDIPDEKLKYEFAFCAYGHRGDHVPIVRHAVRKCAKFKKENLPEEYRLPEELKKAESITVYRAGEEPIENARYRISWTTSKETAEWFLYKWRGRHAQNLYQGTIKPDKVIAYTNDRKESEILQYANVRDIVALPVDAERIRQR